ncbi:MAG: CXXX repeat peptide modification system protein [Clostridia bacterium]|nr:CXXX repeat peptide modification system protein [Clostridia bacterium]
MVREKVGIVTETEAKEILQIFERKMALQELLMTLNNPSMTEQLKNEVYEKIVNDFGRTKIAFDKWWADTANKYQWKSVEGWQWSIDFDTCEIFLVENSKCAC